jgi:hypothetical protein
LTTRALTTDREPDELLRHAQEAAYRLPAGSGGFTAEVLWATDAAEARGTLRVSGPSDLEIVLDDEGQEARAGAQRELASMVGHRWAQSYEEGDGRHEKHLGPEDGLLAGRLVVLDGDPFASSYRVADGAVVQVNRTMGGGRFSIVITARTVAPDGRVLPAQFSVFHWAADSGRLTRTESFSDRYAVVAGVALPAARRVVSATDAGISRRELRLTGHVLLGGER